MKCFCVFGVAMASLWTPGESSLYCRTQNLVFASVNTFHSANQNFDSTLNALHSMALLAEKEKMSRILLGRCLSSRMLLISSTQWSKRLTTIIHVITGMWYHTWKSHRMWSQSWLSGILSKNSFQMGALINTRHGYVLMVECSSMESITGKITHQQWTGSVFVFLWLLHKYSSLIHKQLVNRN